MGMKKAQIRLFVLDQKLDQSQSYGNGFKTEIRTHLDLLSNPQSGGFGMVSTSSLSLSMWGK